MRGLLPPTNKTSSVSPQLHTWYRLTYTDLELPDSWLQTTDTNTERLRQEREYLGASSLEDRRWEHVLSRSRHNPAVWLEWCCVSATGHLPLAPREICHCPVHLYTSRLQDLKYWAIYHLIVLAWSISRTLPSGTWGEGISSSFHFQSEDLKSNCPF